MFFKPSKELITERNRLRFRVGILEQHLEYILARQDRLGSETYQNFMIQITRQVLRDSRSLEKPNG